MRVHKVLNTYGYLPNIPENIPDGHIDVIARAVREDAIRIYRKQQTIENALGVFIVDTLIERLLRGQTWVIAESRFLNGRDILKQAKITSLQAIEKLESSLYIKVLKVGGQSILIELREWVTPFNELRNMLGEHLHKYIFDKVEVRQREESEKLFQFMKTGQEYRLAIGYTGRGSNVTVGNTKIPSLKISLCEFIQVIQVLNYRTGSLRIPIESKQGINQLASMYDSNPRQVDRYLQANKTRKFVELNARGFWND